MEGEEICRIGSENIQITIPGEDDEMRYGYDHSRYCCQFTVTD